MNDDDLLNRAIVRAVRGETSPWDIDPAYPTKDALGKPFTLEERFKAGDKQILLWAIWDYAERGEAIPKWATDALYEVLMRAAKFEFSNWDAAFGKIPAEGTYRSKIRSLVREAIPIGEKIRELQKNDRGITNDLLEELAEKEQLSFRKVRDYWKFYKGLEEL